LAGFSAGMITNNATTAAIRLTHDSSASDNDYTELFKRYAKSFNQIVAIATATGRYANLLSDLVFINRLSSAIVSIAILI
jgi:hypothetical protein